MSRRRVAAFAAVTATIALVVAAPAIAIRPPTRSEAKALQRDLGLGPCDWLAGISTVDPAWARVEADPGRCSAVSALNTLARFDGTRWSGIPWTADLNGLCPRSGSAPDVVVGDLGLCVGPPPPTAVIACDSPRSDQVVHRSAPRICRIEHRSRAYGDVADVHGLRWRRWGQPVARAVGRETGTRVTLRAARLRPRCGRAGGPPVYTRLRIASARGLLAVRRAAC